MPTLYVVATPIGNLSDASARMAETLARVSLIAAEDTRVTGSLMRHFGLHTPMISFHRHNEAEKTPTLVSRMQAEEIDVALVTDAGTPCISDPGYLLVRAAVDAGIPVQPVAGPSALIAALSISSFDAREFAFFGFLPRSPGDLDRKLLSIARQTKVAALYESPHRIIKLMQAVDRVLPGCRACVCCDLTKLYEKTLYGSAADILRALEANPKTAKGEYCVVLDLHDVAIPEETRADPSSLEAQLIAHMLDGRTLQEATNLAVASGIRPNDAKRAALRVKQFLMQQGVEYDRS